MKWISLLVIAMLAGCLGEDAPDSTDDGADITGPGEDPGMENPEEEDPPRLNFAVSKTRGVAPLNVTFDISVTPATNGTYTLFYGDGESVAGSNFPASHSYEYGEGNHTAFVVFNYTTGELEGSFNITVAPPVVINEEDGLCHRPDAIAVGPLYLDDRGGGSTWVYEETNGIAGMQLSAGESPIGFTDDLGAGCLNGDTLLY